MCNKSSPGTRLVKAHKRKEDSIPCYPLCVYQTFSGGYEHDICKAKHGLGPGSQIQALYDCAPYRANPLVHFEDDEVVWPAVSHGGPLPARVLGVPPPHRYQVVLGVADKVPLHQPRGHALHVQVGHLGLIAWAQINIRSIAAVS